MGNCTSFNDEKPQTVTIVDAHGISRRIKAPITAAEIMLDEPGHVVSSALQIRRDRRISALKADEALLAGKVYLLVPASRVNSRVSESDMAFIDSACQKRRSKRRGSKVLPTATEGSSDKVECSLELSQENETGFSGHWLVKPRQWLPALEPISE